MTDIMRIGLHCQSAGVYPDLVVNMARKTGWTKVLNPNESFWNRVGPDSHAVVRLVPRGEDATDHGYVHQGADGAVAYFDDWSHQYRAIQDIADAHDVAVLFEGPNEYHVNSSEQYTRFSAFTAKWIELMHRVGKHRVVMGSFSEGTPEVLDHNLMTKLVRLVVESHADALGLHEYSWTSMDTDTPWHTLRYRWWLNVAKEMGANLPPIFITENGLDKGVVNPGQRKGWKSADISRQEYVDQILWYNAQIAKENAVECAFLYTATPTRDWRDYEVDAEIVDLLIEQGPGERAIDHSLYNYQEPGEPPPPVGDVETWAKFFSGSLFDLGRFELYAYAQEHGYTLIEDPSVKLCNGTPVAGANAVKGGVPFFLGVDMSQENGVQVTKLFE